MKYRVHTGPCCVNEVGAAITRVPGTRCVIIGTEHVLFEHDALSLTEFREQAIAHESAGTRACWAFVKEGR